MVRGVFDNAEWRVCSKQATKSPQQEVSSRYNEVTTLVTAYYALLKTLQQSHCTYFVAKSEQGDCFADRQRFALSILNTPYSEARNDDVLCKRHALHHLYKNRR